jgi:hypothetical protein
MEQLREKEHLPNINYTQDVFGNIAKDESVEEER